MAMLLGLIVLAAYVGFSAWATRATWRWSERVGNRWGRLVLVSAIATVLFMPGVVAGGHGAGIGPAWLMFATGTFDALIPESQVKMLLGIGGGWAIAFIVAWFVTRPKP